MVEKVSRGRKSEGDCGRGRTKAVFRVPRIGQADVGVGRKVAFRRVGGWQLGERREYNADGATDVAIEKGEKTEPGKFSGPQGEDQGNVRRV